MMDLFDAAAAREARERTLKQVADHAGLWMDAALAEIGALPATWCGTGEDIRAGLEQRGLVPHHHNTWGALIGTAVKRRLIVPTGQYVGMRGSRSHARRTPVYRRGEA